MEINAHNMAILYTGINTIFKNAFAKYVDTSWQRFTRLQPVSTAVIEMPYLEQLARMREWIGPRKINKLSAERMSFRTRKFEQTYEVPRESVEDDTYGMYTPLLEEMGKACAQLPNDLIVELLENAASAKWADGANFFGTTRKYGKSAISNYTTSALSQASLKAAYTAMKGYNGHAGDSLKVRPTLLIHGPELKFTVKELLENENVFQEGTNGAAAVPNVTRNLVQSLEVDGLTGGKWFLAATGGVQQPIYYFERKRPDQITRKDQEHDDNVFQDDVFLYGSRGRAEAAFVLPHLIYFGNPS